MAGRPRKKAEETVKPEPQTPVVVEQDDDQLVVLSQIEQERLNELCGVVDRGIKTFVEVGMALAEIRDSRLYRETHPTFDDFCSERWDLGRSRVYQLMDGASVVNNVHNCGQIIPINEAQARPLTLFEADIQREIWSIVLERSLENGGRITAALVSSVCAEYLRGQITKKLDSTRKNVSRETLIAPVFKDRFQAFIDVVSEEINSGFKNTSRSAVLNHIDALRELILHTKG